MTATKNLLITLLLWLPLAAIAEVAVPPLTGHVIDQTGTLNSDQVAALEQKLQDLDAKKGSQLAVLIVPTTQPESIEQYSLRVAEQWQLGRKKVEDGAILIVAKDDRAQRIEVGYGLEGALNDATAKRIITETITPHFQQGNFNEGITAGINQMIQVIDGEPLPAFNPKAASIQQYLPIIFLLTLVLGSLLSAMLGRLMGATLTGGAIALIAWLFIGALSIALMAGVIALLFTLFSGAASGRTGLGGFGRGGFGGGGFGGGGGFSGGGGGFGGGGASGRW